MDNGTPWRSQIFAGPKLPSYAGAGVSASHAPKPTGDTGYWQPQVAEQARALGCQVLVATERRRHGECRTPSGEGKPPEGLDARERMRWRLNTAEGRRVYGRRKVVVEPVNGQIKDAQGFRRFSFRGLQAVEAEWNLMCLCHNVLKLFRYGTVFAAQAA